MSNYKKRPYLKDARTGEVLSTTVMYDGDKRIVGTGLVLSRLQSVMLKKAQELGGKNLQTRDFYEAYSIRGPSRGDVVRQTIDSYVDSKLMRKRDIGKSGKPSYRYDLI
jgi:hypothetical protein